MSLSQPQRPSIWRRVAVAALVTSAIAAMAPAASAGECPADKRVADGHGQPPGPSAPKDVSDVVRSSTDLAKEPLALQGRLFRCASSK